MTVGLEAFLLLGALLFVCGALCMAMKRNAIGVLMGVELVLNNEVHPYDLLRYDRAIFSKAAIEQLTEALVKSVSKRQLAATEAA